MKAKRRFTIASTIFVGLNLILFLGLLVFVIFWNKLISSTLITLINKVSTDSDIGYWLVNSVNDNIAVIILLIILIVFLFIAAKIAFFVNFIQFSRYGIKDFYTRKSKFLAMVIFQLFIIGSVFAFLLGVVALVIQKALVTPDTINKVLSDTWGTEDTIMVKSGTLSNATDKPVVRVGPNAKFVENIVQLRDSVKRLKEVGLISPSQAKSLSRKIDKRSRDQSKKKEYRL